MTIQALTIAPGSKFIVDGVTYTLVKKPNDGGYNWMGEDGFHKLCQSFYWFDGEPTLDHVESMKKYLPSYCLKG